MVDRATEPRDGRRGRGGGAGARRPARDRFELRRGTDEDCKLILYLIDQTVAWLAGRGSDQWQTGREARSERVRRGLAENRTWTVWDGPTLAATITVHDEPDLRLWPQAAPGKAVYPCRLVVDREYAGLGLGAELMDWAGRSARDGYGAEWVRIDVWTTNTALHSYYRSQGFSFIGLAPLRDYPARALFQKPTAVIGDPTRDLFAPPVPNPFGDDRITS